MTRALVIGYGAIGERHARVLAGMGHEVAVASRRAVDHDRRFGDIAAALAGFAPDYAVIANETAAHRPALRELRARGSGAVVLVEKPLFESAQPDDPSDDPRVFVGYNLRFHPLLLRLRDHLRGRRAVAAAVHVGRPLARSRAGRDYRHTYAAQRRLGGGVLRDLSHELDYVLWLFGPWLRVTALGGCSGTLESDVDDRWSILVEAERCAQISVVLSYLDAAPRRTIVVNADGDTAAVDFTAFTFATGDSAAPEHISVAREESYRRQHAAILGASAHDACTYSEGHRVVRLIETIEAAARERRWIARRDEP